jgi:hypothetical protein
MAYFSLRNASEGFCARLPSGLIVSRNRSTTLTLIRKVFVLLLPLRGLGRSSKKWAVRPSVRVRRTRSAWSLLFAQIHRDRILIIS